MDGPTLLKQGRAYYPCGLVATKIYSKHEHTDDTEVATPNTENNQTTLFSIGQRI
jgi:hypothetical protein